MVVLFNIENVRISIPLALNAFVYKVLVSFEDI